ncbi:MAG: DUF1573 domain-containing protein [Bacteroidales bacterium]|nr:DUF1573 domain-containing protein [Bacteroidales bacterium]
MRPVFLILPVALILAGSCHLRAAKQPEETPAPVDPMEYTGAVEEVEDSAAAAVLEVMSGSPEASDKVIVPQASSKKGAVVEGVVRFDKTVHDFGDILVTSGPQSCVFHVENISDKPFSIYEIVSSCGCTEAAWPKTPVAPGESVKISATFSNEDGPLPFDKTLTVYISALKKPVILRLRGNVTETKKSLKELYTVSAGGLSFRSLPLRAGNLEQGESRSDEVPVANTGSAPVHVAFTDVSPQLSISVEPNPVPAGSTATLTFTVRSDRSLWGKNTYQASLNGKRITVEAFTKENFASWTEEQRKAGSQPVFTTSTADFGVVDAGAPVKVEFTFDNRGKSDLVCLKADCDTPGVTVAPVPTLAPGAKGSFEVTLDTSKLPKGDVTAYLILTTNSPLRPIVNLFVVGSVK